jgi:hypothetical protein
MRKINSYEEFIEVYPLLYEFMYKTRFKGREQHEWGLPLHEVAEAGVRGIIENLILSPKTFNEAEQWLEHYQRVPERFVLSKLFPWSWPKSYTEPHLKSKWEDIWYPDPCAYTVLLEPVIKRLNDANYTTINSYGSKILNSKSMMIVDVDINNYDFGPTKCYIPETEELAIGVLEIVARKLGLGFRAYRTCNGLRYIETTRTWDPKRSDTQRVLAQLLCDPLYAALCKSQDTFRARLTPKYWRINGNEDEEIATCELLDVFGNRSVLTIFEEVTDYHDKHTRAVDNFGELCLC